MQLVAEISSLKSRSFILPSSNLKRFQVALGIVKPIRVLRKPLNLLNEMKQLVEEGAIARLPAAKENNADATVV